MDLYSLLHSCITMFGEAVCRTLIWSLYSTALGSFFNWICGFISKVRGFLSGVAGEESSINGTWLFAQSSAVLPQCLCRNPTKKSSLGVPPQYNFTIASQSEKRNSHSRCAAWQACGLLCHNCWKQSWLFYEPHDFGASTYWESEWSQGYRLACSPGSCV